MCRGGGITQTPLGGIITVVFWFCHHVGEALEGELGGMKGKCGMGRERGSVGHGGKLSRHRPPRSLSLPARRGLAPVVQWGAVSVGSLYTQPRAPSAGDPSQR